MTTVGPLDLTTVDLATVDLGDSAYFTDGPPHALFKRLRDEEPVHWSPANQWPDTPGFWSITRPEDIRRISLDWATFSSETSGAALSNDEIFLAFQRSGLIGMDPPRHDRLKALFQRGFTPKRVADHEQMIREIVRRRLDEIAGMPTVDIVEDFTPHIVARVIGSLISYEPDMDKTMSEVSRFAFQAIAADAAIDEAVQEWVAWLIRSVLALVNERRANPTDDLVSALLEAEIDGERLNTAEIIALIAILITGGNDSTRAVFAGGLYELLRNPEQFEELVASPEKIPVAVEEFLRMHPAFAHFARTATKDVELHGKTIRSGDKVVLWYPSANMDESVHRCPHELDIERNPEHQTFGPGGRHFCLGAALARLQLRVLFEETLTRYPAMTLAGEVEWLASPVTPVLSHLPVHLGPACSGASPDAGR